MSRGDILPIDINMFLSHSEWFLRIITATLCGCLIGYERSSRNKGAGMKTHAIISLGSALFMIISKYGFGDIVDVDGSRIAAQIVSGVGFLGAGVIFVRHGTVSGLTTAAGMWATSGVGMCIGSGLYDIGMMSTVLIVGIQTLFHRHFFLKITQSSQNMELEILNQKDALKDIQDFFYHHDLTIHEMKIEKISEKTIRLEIEIVVSSDFNREQLMYEMMNQDYTKKFSYT